MLKQNTRVMIPQEYLIIDTETTGLEGSCNDVIQLGIIDQDGNILHNEYYGSGLESWDEAEEIHGISPEQVRGKSILDQDFVRDITRGKSVIIYNAQFDSKFLDLSEAKEVGCVMETFAEEYGDYNDYFQSYTWQKLTTAYSYYGNDVNQIKAHDAIGDCLMTLSVFRKLQSAHFYPFYMQNFSSENKDYDKINEDIRLERIERLKDEEELKKAIKRKQRLAVSRQKAKEKKQKEAEELKKIRAGKNGRKWNKEQRESFDALKGLVAAIENDEDYKISQGKIADIKRHFGISIQGFMKSEVEVFKKASGKMNIMTTNRANHWNQYLYLPYQIETYKD